MDTLSFAAIHYKAVRERLRTEDPQIDDQCLADTLEGLSATCRRFSQQLFGPLSQMKRWPNY